MIGSALLGWKRRADAKATALAGFPRRCFLSASENQRYRGPTQVDLSTISASITKASMYGASDWGDESVCAGAGVGTGGAGEGTGNEVHPMPCSELRARQPNAQNQARPPRKQSVKTFADSLMRAHWARSAQCPRTRRRGT